MAQAIREDLSAAWVLRACSREGGEGLLSNETLLAGKGSLGLDAIVHCAWSSVPADAGLKLDASASPDIAALKQWIARLADDAHPPLFVFMSTGAVYGPAPERPSREDDVPHPLGAYGEAKLHAEQLLLQSGLPVCILRVVPLYGLPEGKQKRQGVISHIVSAALRGHTFFQWGQDSFKDYLHRTDFCEALQLVVEQRLQGGIWNLSSGEAAHLGELVKFVEQITGRSITVEMHPSPAWDVRINRLDISKLQHATRWSPRISIKEGIEREVQRLAALLAS